MRIAFLAIFWFFFQFNAFASCPLGTYPVQSHSRSSFYRNDGTHVSSTVVGAYCRNYRSDGPIEISYKDRAPSDYPYKKEKFIKCRPNDITKINDRILAFHKVLTSLGKINFYCADKSSVYSNNPASSFIEKNQLFFTNQLSVKTWIEYCSMS